MGFSSIPRNFYVDIPSEFTEEMIEAKPEHELEADRLGAAVATRFNWLRAQKVVMPPDVGIFRPLPLVEIMSLID